MEMVVWHLRRSVEQDAAGDDAQLLTAFINNRDEAAFASLVKRHGPMVWRVCRRLLNHHDAEDCFQVTFLVLARKARSVRPREMVANWLHGVAYRTALQARATRLKQMVREKQVSAMPEPAAAPQEYSDLRAVLDRELTYLPDTYRLPLILCDLGDTSIKEAARQLGWPQGTLAGRLFRARKLLATRLARRGLAVSAGSLMGQVFLESASASLVTSTINSATLQTAVPSKVAALMEGVMTGMVITKLKTAAVVLLVVAAVGIGGGLLSRSSPVAAQAPTLGEQEKRTPATAYKAVFAKTLAVIAEHFEEITYANQYEGWIEARTCQPDASGTLRQAHVRFSWNRDEYPIDIHIRRLKASGDIIGRDEGMEREIVAKLRRHHKVTSTGKYPRDSGTGVNSDGGLTGTVVANGPTGSWRVTSVNGGDEAFGAFKDMDLVFVGERLLVVPKEGPATVYRVHLGARRPVQEFDLYQAGSTATRVLGVYELRNGELRLCLSNQQGTRPTNLEASKTQAVVVARRAEFTDGGTVLKGETRVKEADRN
jgi:RNA polymerase sigma factor (sigma-70 family)